MAQHAILRFEKRKAGPAGALEAHHERTKEQYASNPDIDTSRSRDNFHIIRPTQKYRREIDSRIKAAGCRTRKDSTMFVDTLIITGIQEHGASASCSYTFYREVEIIASSYQIRARAGLTGFEVPPEVSRRNFAAVLPFQTKALP